MFDALDCFNGRPVCGTPDPFPLHEPPLSRPSATLSPPCGERAGRGVPIWFMVPMRCQFWNWRLSPEPRENIEHPTSNFERRSERGSALPFDVRRWMFDVGCSSGFRGREQLSTGLGRPTAAVQFLKVFPSHESRSSRREEAHDSKSEIRNPKSEIDESLLSS